MSSLPEGASSSSSYSTASRSEPAPSVAVRTAARVFAERFGTAPRWLAVAPGRVNLIGEHTDYNGGYVLPLAIDRHVVIAGGPAAADSGRVRAYSAALDASVDIRLDGSEAPGEPAWANYLRGVVSAFCERGLVPAPVDAAIVSDVPLGGGLSSSAALEVATATLLEAVTGAVLDPREKARICRQAEHEFAGVPCGLMDQLASVMGDEAGALLIDCRFEVVRVVPFADPAVSVLICNTNVKHALADGAYARRRTECAEASRQLGVPSLRDATPAMVEAARGIFDPVVRRRARHVTTENHRTLAAATHLEAREFAEVGALMYESHRSLRDDFEVSSAELDTLVDVAGEIGAAGGVLGARMTGGGFGGCTVTLVRTEHVGAVAETLANEYRNRTGHSATSFVSRPARGAHLVDPLTVI
ncbi:MAG TPA: galactokinase [Polyangia bacterium]|nr:galactokinase [Polyangia bacterium]